MKNFIIALITMLITNQLIAQPGRSGHSNGFIIRQQSRITGSMHANAASNAKAINHANSNSVFGTSVNHSNNNKGKKSDNFNNGNSKSPQGDIKDDNKVRDEPKNKRKK